MKCKILKKRPRKKVSKEIHKRLTSGEPDIYEDGEWTFQICCACGYTHLMKVDILSNKKVSLRFWEDRWQTEKNRKKKK